MKNKIKLSIYTVAVILFMGCDDYLDVEPKGLLIPNTIEDYELLLNSNEIVTSNDESILFNSTDDFYDIGSPSFPILPIGSPALAAYTWSEVIYTEDQDPLLWSVPYRNIFTYNSIIDEIDDAIGDDISLKAAIKAEALTGRSFEYLLLVNAFAKHYDANSASNDLGVPLITTPDVNQIVPPRASVAETYDLIIGDLTQALVDLPSENINRFRATKAAAYGLLARVHLFQGDYASALVNAQSSLDEKNFLANYTTVVTSDPGPFGQFGARRNMESLFIQEQVYHRFFQASGGYAGFPTPEVQSLFEAEDLRKLTTMTDFGGFFSSPFWQTFPLRSNHAVSVPEMYLIRAECNARLGNLQEALDDINLIRSHRILPASYADIVSSDAGEVLQEVLNERRRELLATGLRWFDLKRLNKEPEFAKTITHDVEGTIFTLEPNSNNYVLPIPLQVIGFNPDMQQNPRE